jgi:hypothetical protein
MYDLADSVALYSLTADPLPCAIPAGCLDLDAAAEADVLLNRRYDMRPETLRRFRRSALLDLDPGMLQSWVTRGDFSIARHDAYFSIGEGVGRPGSRIPDLGVRWQHTVPCVALDWWQFCRASRDAPFTTVTHWSWGSQGKRSGFQRYLDLPRVTSQPMELALSLIADDEFHELEARGWRIRDAHNLTSTPWDYQHYIQSSFGEFSCARPIYVRLNSGWVSDRTVCYLASGKPVVVQNTGPSDYLPSSAGMFRFRSPDSARRSLERVIADYEQQSKLARDLAEEHFDARNVAASVLERTLA